MALTCSGRRTGAPSPSTSACRCWSPVHCPSSKDTWGHVMTLQATRSVCKSRTTPFRPAMGVIPWDPGFANRGEARSASQTFLGFHWMPLPSSMTTRGAPLGSVLDTTALLRTPSSRALGGGLTALAPHLSSSRLLSVGLSRPVSPRGPLRGGWAWLGPHT